MKARDVYDSIGNEIFAPVIEKLKAQGVDITDEHGIIQCTFDDGSVLQFQDGFAHVFRPTKWVPKIEKE